jgi:hypothetical protein
VFHEFDHSVRQGADRESEQRWGHALLEGDHVPVGRERRNEVPLSACEVVLDPLGGGLLFIECAASGGERRHATEPGTSWRLRAGVGVLSVLPIDWLL